jgi:hypothetical protein
MTNMQALAAALLLLSAGATLAASGHEGAGRPGQTAEQMQPVQPAQQAGAQQEVSGNVSEIDQTKGLVTLATSVGTLKLHFPPPSLRDLGKGDVITAHYGFASPGEGSLRVYDAPRGRGEHQLVGTVTGINHGSGSVEVTTDEATLQLFFQPQAVRDLKQGDTIIVDLSFTKGA